MGAVVGGTHPEEGAALRRRMPAAPLLIPGYGAQGGGAGELTRLFDENRQRGVVVNSARAILYAYRKSDWIGRLQPSRGAANAGRALAGLRTRLSALHTA